MLFTEPEVIGAPGQPSVRLIADASQTGGAASVQQVTLPIGADGATPHFHRLSTEIFYVLSGRLDLMLGERVHNLSRGQVATVDPNTVHAFGASAGAELDVLIVLTPGVERFGYFRLLAGVLSGQRPLADLQQAQSEYDNHFVDSPVWKEFRDSAHHVDAE